MKEWKSTICCNGCVHKTVICAFSKAVPLSCLQAAGQCVQLGDVCFEKESFVKQQVSIFKKLPLSVAVNLRGAEVFNEYI